MNYIYKKTFMKKPIEERNSTVQRIFKKLETSLLFTRRHVPELVTHPDTGEMGFRIVKGGYVCMGSYYPVSGAVQGDVMEKGKGRYNCFRYSKCYNDALHTIDRLCFPDRCRSRKLDRMLWHTVKERNEAIRETTQAKAVLEKVVSERTRLEVECSFLKMRLDILSAKKLESSGNVQNNPDNGLDEERIGYVRAVGRPEESFPSTRDINRAIDGLIIDVGAVPPVEGSAT